MGEQTRSRLPVKSKVYRLYVVHFGLHASLLIARLLIENVASQINILFVLSTVTHIHKTSVAKAPESGALYAQLFIKTCSSNGVQSIRTNVY